MLTHGQIIACFDLGTMTGVATGVVGQRPKLETWGLSGERPDRLVMFEDLLALHFDAFDLDRVFYEAPLPIAILMRIGATEQTVQMLRSMVAVLETYCARKSLPVASGEVKRARRAVTGYGFYPKGEAKRAVMKFCRVLGYMPANDNEADALIGFLYESAMLNPRMAHLTTPLFAAVR